MIRNQNFKLHPRLYPPPRGRNLNLKMRFLTLSLKSQAVSLSRFCFILPHTVKKSKSKPQIFSIGHSNRTFDEFVEVLNRFGIEALADIRSFPRSGRNPHFDRERLETELPSLGTYYIWIKNLGGMRKEGYTEYLKTADFSEGLAELESIANGKKTAFMCSELSWRRCHRRFVATALRKRGWEVVHIYNIEESELHSGLPGL